MEKRGQGIQFNWIFVIVAGALFLIFFAFFSVRYIDLEQSKENGKIVRALDSSILGAKGISQYKVFGEDFSDFVLEYNCERLYINEDQFIESSSIIFVEDKSEGPFSMWSQDYEKPYLVDTVVYLWNFDLKFYFSGVSEEFMDEIPNELKITSEGNADVLVYFGGAEPNPNKKVIAFNGNQIWYVNEDKYFNYNGDNVFVYGAMFSSPDVFECSKNYLEERKNSLKELYIKKAQYFGSKCAEYGQIIGALRDDNINSIISLNEALDNHGCEVIY